MHESISTLKIAASVLDFTLLTKSVLTHKSIFISPETLTASALPALKMTGQNAKTAESAILYFKHLLQRKWFAWVALTVAINTYYQYVKVLQKEAGQNI